MSPINTHPSKTVATLGLACALILGGPAFAGDDGAALFEESMSARPPAHHDLLVRAAGEGSLEPLRVLWSSKCPIYRYLYRGRQ